MDDDIVAIGLSFDRWEELFELILSSFSYMNGIIDPPSSALSMTPQSLREKARQEIGFVAREDDELTGCIFCRPEPPSCLYIGKLAVAPSHQNRGIGTRLMGRADDLARSIGYRQLRLETRIELTDNHRRFRSMGFELFSEGRHRGFDRTTFIEMRKRVSGG
ncbi:GNAT family N-acetyltransferase [Ciceribacter sp. L1K23]|uniref:GNAT family N-acetyltransferase n=1 Tax=Ciceribacter sp. L1K23 TaxID=2820276 RepID=UPI001B8178CD|nr:GNAT family N-acetyltransferase [Ciceribacter sp. L1K23]MBR0557546.1 GNAT family N-acetyltransferase [Ciceribacter sp. L1K23]